MKELRKKFNEAIKTKQKVLESKENYIESQKELRQAKNNEIREDTKKIVEKIIKEGGARSNTFWRLRRKLNSKSSNANYTTIDEKGTPIEDPEKAKKHIADFFEDLYTAREGTQEHEETTKMIKEAVEKLMNDEKINGLMKKITMEELKNIIRKLKLNKATGPDQIPNKLFIYTEEAFLKIILEILNHILMKKEIPDQWQIGEIIRLYKGKGTLGKCSNERGITLGSNFGKLFERIINERITKKLNISINQAGGQKNRSTSEHIILTKELIRNIRRKKKAAYVVFLDVTKAYDKAWLDAIMYVLNKEGIDTPEWLITKKTK